MMAVHRCRIIMTKRSGLSWNKGSVKRRKDKFLTDKAFAQSNGKNGFIELCRFVFCWGVVSHHAKFLSESPGYIPIFGGYISVEFFFILTGYLMYASYHKAQSAGKEQDSAIHQIYVKLKRIYPYFLVTFCAVFILVHIRRVLPPPPEKRPLSGICCSRFRNFSFCSVRDWQEMGIFMMVQHGSFPLYWLEC